MTYPIHFMLAGLICISPALAEERAEALPAAKGSQIPATSQWLELQRSGQAASTHAQPLSGEAMDKVHKRYLKSFEQPIPEFYEHEMRATR